MNISDRVTQIVEEHQVKLWFGAAAALAGLSVYFASIAPHPDSCKKTAPVAVCPSQSYSKALMETLSAH